MRRSLAPLLLTTSLAALAICPGAPASAAVTGPVLLPAVDAYGPVAENLDGPLLGVEDAGRATVAWVGYPNGTEQMNVAVRDPGAAAYVTPQSFVCDDSCWAPALGMNAAGAAVLAWVEVDYDTETLSVVAATRPAGAATFDDPVVLASGPFVEFPGERQVGAAVTPSGEATVVWYDAAAGTLLAAASSTSSAAWSAPAALPSSGGNVELVVDSDSTGELTVAWLNTGGALGVATGSGATFGAPETLPGGGDAVAQLAMDVNASGKTALTWAYRGGDNDWKMSLTTRDKGGSFSAPIPVTSSEQPLFVRDTDMVVAPDGTITSLAVLDPFNTEEETFPTTVEAVTIPAAGGDPAVQVLDVDPDSLRSPRVVAALDGARTAVWNAAGSGDGDVFALRFAHAAPGQPFGAVDELVEEPSGVRETFPAVGVDGGGDVTVAWKGTDEVGDASRIGSRVLDVAGPVISAASAPATATTGSPASFAATASDRWSNPTTVTWDFGDGQSGSGANPQHTYTAQGSYVVTVTATDAVGHETTSSVGTIEVSPAGSAFDYSGLLAPIDALPTVNKAKAGSSVPVKFSLGGDHGLDVLVGGAPTSSPVACGDGAVDQLESTVSANKKGLTYDAGSDTYTYVWATEKRWAGTCRNLKIALTDGTTQVVSFTFK